MLNNKERVEQFMRDWYDIHPRASSPMIVDLSLGVDYIPTVILTHFELRDAEGDTGRRWEERCLRELCELVDLRLVTLRFYPPFEAVRDMPWYQEGWLRLRRKPLPKMGRQEFKSLLKQLGFDDYTLIDKGWTRYPRDSAASWQVGRATPPQQRQIIQKRLAEVARLDE